MFLLLVVFLLCYSFDIFVTPIDSTIVTIAGNPSGIAATANPTDVINISIGSIFFIIPIKKISMHIAKHAIPNIFPTCSNFFLDWCFWCFVFYHHICYFSLLLFSFLFLLLLLLHVHLLLCLP